MVVLNFGINTGATHESHYNNVSILQNEYLVPSLSLQSECYSLIKFQLSIHLNVLLSDNPS